MIFVSLVPPAWSELPTELHNIGVTRRFKKWLKMYYLITHFVYYFMELSDIL